jgi:acyl carrier protein
VTDSVPEKFSVEEIEQRIVAEFCKRLRLSPQAVDVNAPIIRYGLESPDGVALTEDLARWTGLPVPMTLFWDHPTIREAATFVAAIANGRL